MFSFSTLLGLVFLTYIVFVVFGVLNVVTGIFVETAIKSKEADADVMFLEQTQQRNRMEEMARQIFASMDTDGSGTLEAEELEAVIDNPHIQTYFTQMGMDVEGGTSAKGLFNLLDFNEDGCIGIEEFIFGCARFKGYARSLDIARLIHIQRENSSQLAMLCEDLHSVGEVLGIPMIARRQTCLSNTSSQCSDDQPTGTASSFKKPEVPQASIVASNMPRAIDVKAWSPPAPPLDKMTLLSSRRSSGEDSDHKCDPPDL